MTRLKALCVLAAAAPVLAACGFSPLYGKPGVTSSLAAIQVATPEGRTGELIREHLDDVLAHDAAVGRRVAIIGAGGIGFDVAEFLVEPSPSPSTDIARWTREWGIDPHLDTRGGLAKPEPEAPSRQIWLLQRSPGRPGARLNKTTGWVHRATLKAKQVTMLGGISYDRLDADGPGHREGGRARR